MKLHWKRPVRKWTTPELRAGYREIKARHVQRPGMLRNITIELTRRGVPLP